MTNFRITSESLPARCDICHQADCFDAATGVCSRCADLVVVEHVPKKSPGGPVRLFSSISFGVTPGAIAYRSFFYAAFLLSFIGIFWDDFPVWMIQMKYRIQDNFLPPDQVRVREEFESRNRPQGAPMPRTVLDPFESESEIGSPSREFIGGLAAMSLLTGPILQVEGMIVLTEEKGFWIRKPNDQREWFLVDNLMLEAQDKSDLNELRRVLQPGNVVTVNCRENDKGDRVLTGVSFTRRDKAAFEAMKQTDGDSPSGYGCGFSMSVGNAKRMTRLCCGYGDLPVRSFTGYPSGPPINLRSGIKAPFKLKTESGKVETIFLDKMGTVTFPVNTVYLEGLLSRGNKLRVDARVLADGTFVVETVERIK